MSNLGLYQVMTTVAKKVGGPKVFLGLVAAGGYGVFRLGEVGVKEAVKIGKRLRNKKVRSASTFTVKRSAIDKQGLKFNIGDQFRVLESDGNAVLLELIGHDSNPFFVSGTFLQSISDYRPVT
mgnify:CR=1 FL=1